MPALAKPASPVLEELNGHVDADSRLVDADEQLFIEEGGPFETVRETAERLIREIQEEAGQLDLGRKDPPEDQWPGRWVDARDVMLSSGDERDWFTFPQRMEAHVRAMKLFRRARKHRLRRARGLSPGFDFAQIMWVGDMGASKSVSAAEEAFFWFQRGHPFFHNGGFNFGRVVEGADIYEIIANVPMYSVIAIDEAHTGLESGMSMSTGVRGFAILCAGLRKKGCKLLLMSAMARMIVRIVREMTSEVRRPFKVEAAPQDHGYNIDYKPRNDPRNFVLAWEKWGNFPFRGVDIVDGKGARKRNDGLGRADDVQGMCGESVRNAYLLTDSFRPVDTAHAQRYAGKAAMEEARAAQAASGFNEDHQRVAAWLVDFLNGPDCPTYVKTDVIALGVGMKPRAVGQLMNGIFGRVDRARSADHGWRTERLKVGLSDTFGIDFDEERELAAA